MTNYLIGDIHGCFNELKKILSIACFNYQKDTLWLTGDIIARGPDSLKVINFVRELGNCIRLVLGNHEINLLATYHDVIPFNIKDKINDLLESKYIDSIIKWLRYQPVLQLDQEKKIIMVHAGISPKWNINEIYKYSYEISKILKGKNYVDFIKLIFNKTNHIKCNSFIKAKEYINIFTRIRFCFKNGKENMKFKQSPYEINNLKPWFNMIKTCDYSVIFGHWSTLGEYPTPKNIYCLDTGCCWGKKLTMLCWENKKIISVKSSINYK